MKHSVTAIVGRTVLCGLLAWGAAFASPGKGPKIVEIDEAGNVRTTPATDIGAPQGTKRDPGGTPMARDGNAHMSICDPRYRWLPSEVSTDTVARARAFYRDVTRKYEREGQRARERGVHLSRERELEYWNETNRFLDSVPRNERKVVDRGISPRFSWWCNAPPVIVKPTLAPPTPLGKN